MRSSYIKCLSLWLPKTGTGGQISLSYQVRLESKLERLKELSFCYHGPMKESEVLDKVKTYIPAVVS